MARRKVENPKEPRLGRRTANSAGPGAQELSMIALDLFAKKHFSSVSIRDIGRAADVNSAMIYYHFRDKRDLFNAAIDNAIEDAFRLFEVHCQQVRHENAVSAINAWFDVHVTLYKRLRNVIKISLDCSSSAADFPGANRSIRRFYRHENKILSEIIRGGIEAGIFREVEPTIIATMISAFLDGVLARSLILRNFDLPATVEEFKCTLWQHLGCDSKNISC